MLRLVAATPGGLCGICVSHDPERLPTTCLGGFAASAAGDGPENCMLILGSRVAGRGKVQH